MEINAINKKNDCKACADQIPFMLPEDFKVYTNNRGLILNWPRPGLKEITLPTFNDYLGEDGGYVALYTRDPNAGLYSVGNEGGSTIYVMGQVRVQGYYHGRIFIPTDGDRAYKLGDNITRDEKILTICKQYFPEMQNDFWIGGDTGGWLGIPR